MGKRGQNEGSIYRRKDGSYSTQISQEGKRVTKYFKTHHEANKWREDYLSQIEGGLSIAGAEKTTKEFLEGWLDTKKESVRSKTIEQYRQIVFQHIVPGIGKLKLKDLSPDKIQDFYAKESSRGVGKRTIQLIHCVLHSSLKQALLWGLIGRNPSDAVIKPKIKHNEMHTLNDTEVRNLLLNSKGTRLNTLLHLAITTGLREGELLGLKWSDFDFDRRSLQIQRQLQRLKDKGLVFSEPKTALGRRKVILGRTEIELLHDHKKQQEIERRFAGEKWHEDDLIFSSSIGTPWDPRNLVKLFKQLLRKAKLPNIRFHDLRHTAATLMLLQGIHPKVVQERLGHSDISLTLNTYSHVLPGMQKEAADKMDELISLIDVTSEIKDEMKLPSRLQ